MRFTRYLSVLTAGMALALTACDLQAQAYPSRPITILVGLSPGGTFDTISRLFAAQIGRKWNQSVVVENRLGGGGTLAASALAKSVPDGYTLGMTSDWNAEFFVKDLGYNPRDIEPISIVGVSPYALVVGKEVTAKTLAEFVAQAKAKPGSMNFGVVPAGSHEAETRETQFVLGIQGTTVGYKGIAPIYVALMAGELHATLGTSSSQLRAGQLRALAIGGEKRFPELPDVPTFRESGYNYDPVSYYPLWIRVETPRDILARLAAEANELSRSPEFAEKVTKPFAIVGLGATPEESRRLVSEQYEHIKQVVTRAGIKPQ